MFQVKMNFCSNCSAKVELTKIDGDSIARYYCEVCDIVHYTNPKLIVGVLPYFEDKVLLCRRAIEPRKGLWNIPAGFLENHELAEEGGKREVWEEAEAEVNIDGTLAIYSIPQANQVYIHFYGKLKEGHYGCGIESLECKLFKENEIPWNEIAFTSSTFALKRYFEDRKKGKIETHIGAFNV